MGILKVKMNRACENTIILLTANNIPDTEKTPEFMRNGGVRRLQRHGLKADGNYGKVDNLHIYYTGNRITGVLEDAATVTTNGSMDYAGKTGQVMEVEYNEWGAMKQGYLGNNCAVVNGSTGEIEQTVAYYPYGAVIADLGISTLNQPFKFGGKELTTQNGLNEYDFGARQYYTKRCG